MKLTKAPEIIQLNLDEASPKMPPDVKDALTLSVKAFQAILHFRSGSDTKHLWLLPGETPE